MEEQLISFETAVIAKDKGFNEPCFSFYLFDSKDLQQINLRGFKNTEFIRSLSAPPQSLLQKWIRDIHKIHIEPTPASDAEYGVIYGNVDTPEWIRNDKEEDPLYFGSYEDALEAGLLAALKLIP